jgi:hypothetical protein
MFSIQTRTRNYTCDSDLSSCKTNCIAIPVLQHCFSKHLIRSRAFAAVQCIDHKCGSVALSTVQMLGVAAATTGLAIGLSKFDALYDSLHAKLGLAVGCLIWAQPLLGLIRPHKYFKSFHYVSCSSLISPSLANLKQLPDSCASLESETKK